MKKVIRVHKAVIDHYLDLDDVEFSTIHILNGIMFDLNQDIFGFCNPSIDSYIRLVETKHFIFYEVEFDEVFLQVISDTFEDSDYTDLFKRASFIRDDVRVFPEWYKIKRPIIIN